MLVGDQDGVIQVVAISFHGMSAEHRRTFVLRNQECASLLGGAFHRLEMSP